MFAPSLHACLPGPATGLGPRAAAFPQVKLLQSCLKSALGADAARNVDVNTIDGFQGREKDVTFFSCVRSVLPPTDCLAAPG